MKTLATHTSTFAVGLAIGLMLSGCAATHIKQLSGSDFVTRAKEMEIVSSFSWMAYIGHSDQRAYLEFGYPAFVGKGIRTTILWTPLSELPDELVLKLKAENPPWKPWDFNTNKTESINFTAPKGVR